MGELLERDDERKTLPEITIGDRIYRILFPDLVRPLTERESRDLRASIEKHGIKVPIVIDADYGIGEVRGVIDGGHRLTIAAEVGLPVVPERVVECASDEEKRQLALTLNVDRRHLSVEERQRVVDSRRQRVRQGTDQGRSQRSLAEEEGVSESQIRKDLAASPAHQCAPDKPENSPEEKCFDSSPAHRCAGDESKHLTEVNQSGACEPEQTSAPDGVPGLAEPAAPASAPLPTIRGADGKSYSSRNRRKNASSSSIKEKPSEHGDSSAQVDLEARERSVAIKWGQKAVECLSRIPLDDVLRADGIRMVANWIKSNK